MTLIMKNKSKLTLAKQSLLGISIGDAFGESFFGETEMVKDCIKKRKIPKSSWEFTDDTVMSIAIFEELEISGKIDQDRLANKFSKNHEIDPNRGYGATARSILREIGNGADWSVLAKNVFDGMGSMGNGASMRVGPIGAYYYDDFEKVKTYAIQSAEITHSNQEGICGAIAVGIATAVATRSKLENKSISPKEFIIQIINELPDSDTKSKIKKSLSVPYTYNIETVKSILGNGIKMTAQDTVPFGIWCAANNLLNFEESIWKAVSVLGDRDTICAIVGGITIMSSHEDMIPKKWVNSVEQFEKSPFRNN